MIVLLAIALIVQAEPNGPTHVVRTKPTSGPALSLVLLKDAELQFVRVGSSWANGCRFVRFSYRTSLSVKKIAEQSRHERYFEEIHSRSDPDSFWFSRRANGVYQSISVRRQTTSFSTTDSEGSRTGTRTDPFTLISITESPMPDQSIPRWYWEAISEDPPTPMIRVPFLTGVMTTEVSVTSFDGLMSGKGLMFVGSDAFVYSAVVEQSYEMTEELLEAWASKNGYTKTAHYGSWFKARVRLFEIEVTSHYSPGREMSRIVIYASDRKAVHPIERNKI